MGGRVAPNYVVIDLYTRTPVGWALPNSPNKKLVCQALTNAYVRELPPKGLIHHSDRGSQYTSNKFKALLQKHGMIGSMSRIGNPYDNAVAESFFRSLKCERTNRYRYSSLSEVYRSVYYYIEVFLSVLGRIRRCTIKRRITARE